MSDANAVIQKITNEWVSAIMKSLQAAYEEGRKAGIPADLDHCERSDDGSIYLEVTINGQRTYGEGQTITEAYKNAQQRADGEIDA